MISVLIADDHPLVRAGLRSLLAGTDDILVIGEAANGQEAVAAAEQLSPDVVLMDLSMPVVDGVGATREILARRPHTAVVVLTSFVEQKNVAGALGAGAVGFILKDCEPHELTAAIRAAAGGHAPLDPRVARTLLPKRGSQPSDELSEREVQVLRLVAKGLANKQIGRTLGISERTVKAHLGNIFRRIGVTDRTSAAIWARDHLAIDAPHA